MNVIDLEILIPASPEFIWRFLGDLAALPQWQKDVVSVSFLSTQREGRGARWRASSENSGDVVYEASAWYDTLGYEYRVKDGTSFGENQGRVRLHESTDGTLVRWTFHYELKGVLGGIRNTMRIKRATTKQIQDSLRNLHQLVMKESGGISTHEAKASVKEAPDVGERLAYQPRHPSAFQDPAVQELAGDELDTDTDRQAALYDFDVGAAPLPAALETDTKPNPVVLAPAFELEGDIQPAPQLGDTEPVVVEALIAAPPPPSPKPTVPPRAQTSDWPESWAPEPLRSPPRETRDSSELSVFEIFGLQKPSEASNAERTLGDSLRDIDAPAPQAIGAAPVEPSRFEERSALTPTEASTEAQPDLITGLRRRERRRRSLLRSHSS